MDIREVNFGFEFFDDTTSENLAKYRETITSALVVYLKSGEATPNDARRIDKLLCDCYRTEATTYDALGRPTDDIEDEVIG